MHEVGGGLFEPAPPRGNFPKLLARRPVSPRFGPCISPRFSATSRCGNWGVKCEQLPLYSQQIGQTIKQ